MTLTYTGSEAAQAHTISFASWLMQFQQLYFAFFLSLVFVFHLLNRVEKYVHFMSTIKTFIGGTVKYCLVFKMPCRNVLIAYGDQ